MRKYARARHAGTHPVPGQAEPARTCARHFGRRLPEVSTTFTGGATSCRRMLEGDCGRAILVVMSDSDDAVPLWARRSAGESRLAATVAVLAVIAPQWLLPDRLTVRPSWVIPALTLLLLLALIAGNPIRLDREDQWLRTTSLVLSGTLGFATAWSVDRLVFGLVDGELSNNPRVLLGSGGAIWVTNVLVFALWYWEFDRGGPAARAHGRNPLPDLLFPQMQSPNLASQDWEPQFMDYLYLAFTNATAFSPTDVMPMSRWTKAMMTVQASISFITGILVIARAVNVLK